jgi:uncharacterized protein YhfF
MAFNTIRAKLAAGEYDGDTAWDDLQKDMETMFTNAMTYNPPDTFVHKQVRRVQTQADPFFGYCAWHDDERTMTFP